MLWIKRDATHNHAQIGHVIKRVGFLQWLVLRIFGPTKRSVPYFLSTVMQLYNANIKLLTA